MTSTTVALIAVGILLLGMGVVFFLKEAINCLFKSLLFLGVLAIAGILVVAFLAH